MLRGALFTGYFLNEGITETDAWTAISGADVERLRISLGMAFAAFPMSGSPNESQTEQDLIFPVLRALGWEQTLTQIRANLKGRSDVPDMLLFADSDAKARANAEIEPARKFRHGVAICENKAWQSPLDRVGKDKLGESAPSTQILRYLTVADVQSERNIQWGILTNGRHWRLYYQQARSRSEEFLELDLAEILGLSSAADGVALADENRTHWLKVFLLMFRREAFLPSLIDRRTFHHVALDEGRHWEERVAKNLSDLVFEEVFPSLIEGIAANDPEAPKPLIPTYLADVKQAALILLYRLLFVLYAEDRNLLPVRDRRYDDYGLRLRVREDIAKRVDDAHVFAESLGDYYSRVQRLFRAIAKGERSLGVPPYNGGLFDSGRTPILDRIELPDSVFAPVVDALSRHTDERGKRWINYRDLSVQQLGSIYERLLEFEPGLDAGRIVIRPNIFARRGTGSYYTPEELVALIIERTIGPLVDERRDLFTAKATTLTADKRPFSARLSELATLDPATAILELRICDPAMGSGHFLVSLVDYLADRILEAIAEARNTVTWAPYSSPLVKRIATLRDHITARAAANKWAVEEAHLDDRLIVRRLLLKRVVHGVDMNPMAVELAKVSLWLHTFTVGAPLSFLDHHLRCGNSLFGEDVRPVMDELSKRFNLLINRYVTKARKAAEGMRKIEDLSDIDIEEAQSSAAAFNQVVDDTRPLDALLDLRQALRWLGVSDLRKKKLHPALVALFDGTLGELLALATGRMRLADDGEEPVLATAQNVRATGISQSEVITTAARILGRAGEVIRAQRFLHWQVAFPDIWTKWDSSKPSGGFDALIGNPPWDRMKLQEVEWFAARMPAIALAHTAADRKDLIRNLYCTNDPLVADYEKARRAAEAATRVARDQGNYPLLSTGDINIYSLFVERALALLKPTGIVGLLVPSGIASDLSSSEFFRAIAGGKRLGALLDFFNRRSDGNDHFPDVYYRFKFCALIVGGEARKFDKSLCGFNLREADDILATDRTVVLSSSDFLSVNPNTGTAPLFSSARDAELTMSIYSRMPVLVDRRHSDIKPAWPIRYMRMLDMTNDSGLFRTEDKLKDDGCYRTSRNRWRKGANDFVPLYEGKMVQAYDHRAASIVVKAKNVHRPGQPLPATADQHGDPSWFPNPQFWVAETEIDWPQGLDWAIAFKDVTSTTNSRTIIAAIVPRTAAGNTLPLIFPILPETSDSATDVEDTVHAYKQFAPLLLANLNCFACDYLARQKVQGQHLNWYIMEQLAVLPAAAYRAKIGKRTAEAVIKDEVLKLSYTAHDLADFAQGQGHDGPPFAWNEEGRRHSQARIDALFFLLYGLDREAA